MDIENKNIMSYGDFKDRLVVGLQDHYGHEEKVVVGSIVKPNMGRLTSISLEKPDMTPILTLYIEQLYEEYEKCGDISEVIGKTVAALSMIPEEYRKVELPDFTDPNIVMERAFCQLIGIKGNEAFLETVPHKRHDDLAIIYRMLIEKRDNEVGSAKITNNNFNGLGISLDALHERALANTDRFFPAKVMCLPMMISITEFRDGSPPLLTLTHEATTLGAIAAFYPGVLQHISERTGRDLLLLPSSVHEGATRFAA